MRPEEGQKSKRHELNSGNSSKQFIFFLLYLHILSILKKKTASSGSS